jgi:5-formyltetrahydrofolate cyclo-ligase
MPVWSARTPALIPGTRFDLHGGRKGHGRGFYDRWLAARGEVLRIGVALEEQVVKEPLVLQPHDQRMDLLVTAERLIRFAPA